MIQIKDKKFTLFIQEKNILDRVFALGRQITEDYRGRSPLMIGVMNGAFMFLSDLVKHVDLPLEISFIKLSSYSSMSSSGNVKPVVGLVTDVKDRELIIVEDIVDTGLSMTFLLALLQEQKPKSIQIASLLLKPDALQKDVFVKYLGFEIPDKFVVGYGLDYEEYGRNLREIYQLA